MPTTSNINNQVLTIADEKRKKVLKKIKELPAEDLQIIYQMLFKEEIITAFDNLPKPRKTITDEQLSAYMTKKRQENGFYK